MKTLGTMIKAEMQTAANSIANRNRSVFVNVCGTAALEDCGMHLTTIVVSPRILDNPRSTLSKMSESRRARCRNQAKTVFDKLCDRFGNARVILNIGGSQYRRNCSNRLVRVGDEPMESAA